MSDVNVSNNGETEQNCDHVPSGLVDAAAANTVLQSRIDALEDEPLFIANIYNEKSGQRELDPFKIYLHALPEEHRQTYHCATCKEFLRKFSRLVRINDDGTREAALYSEELPAPYNAALRAVKDVIEKRPVETIALYDRTEDISLDGYAGFPVTGEYKHLAFKAPKHLISNFPDKEKNDFRHSVDIVEEIFKYYDLPLVERAVNLLRADAVHGGNIIQGPLEFLLRVMRAVGQLQGSRRRAVLFKHCARQPEGFFHIRGSVSGVWLDGLKDPKRSLASVVREVEVMLHGANYKHPTNDPSSDELQRARAAFEVLGQSYKDAIKRTFALMSDIKETIWSLKAPNVVTKEDDIFASVKTRDKAKEIAQITYLPGVRDISLNKFVELLKTADELEVNIPFFGRFTQFTTQYVDTSAPILVYDFEHARNPVAWYQLQQPEPNPRMGDYASNWNVSTGWCKASAFIVGPQRWNGVDLKTHSATFHILVPGMKHQRAFKQCLFMSLLKDKFKEFKSRDLRRVIESYSDNTPLIDREGEVAAGMLLMPDLQLRITSNNIATTCRVVTID